MRFLSDDRRHPTPEMHLSICDSLVRDRRAVFKAPRSYAKSTWVCKRFPLYLCYNSPYNAQLLDAGGQPEVFPHREITIMSGTGPLAKAWLDRVKIAIETNELLFNQYGDIKGRIWNQDEILTRWWDDEKGKWVDGVHIRAVGRGYQQRGWRPTLLLCDDLDDDEEVLNGERLEKAKDWWDGPVINVLDEIDTQCFVIGTVVAEDTLLEHIARKKGWKVYHYAAYEHDEADVPIEKPGHETWPSKWPHERLQEQEADIGRKKFKLEFLSIAEGHEAQIIERGWFRKYTPEVLEHLMQKYDTYTCFGFDPAISRKDGADYSALVALTVVFRGDHAEIYVRHAERGHWSVTRQVNKIFDTYDDLWAHAAIVETNAYQAALADLVEVYVENKARTINIERVVSTSDKESRLRDISPMVERGMVYVNFDDEGQKELVDECVRFVPGAKNIKKDMMDAFVHAMRHVRNVIRNRRPRPQAKRVLPQGVGVNPLTGMPTVRTRGRDYARRETGLRRYTTEPRS